MNRIFFTLLLLTFTYSEYCLSQNADNNSNNIIANIKRQYVEINSSINKYKQREKDIQGESSEGGVIIGYYYRNELKKISVRYYGETGNILVECYLNNNMPFFILESESSYDKPIYIDGATIVAVTENRFYFHKNELIKWIMPGNKEVKKNAKSFSQSNTRLIEDIEHYKKMLGTFTFQIDYITLTDTVKCKFGSMCPSTGYIIKDSRDSTGNVIHVKPRNKNVPIEN